MVVDFKVLALSLLFGGIFVVVPIVYVLARLQMRIAAIAHRNPPDPELISRIEALERDLRSRDLVEQNRPDVR